MARLKVFLSLGFFLWDAVAEWLALMIALRRYHSDHKTITYEEFLDRMDAEENSLEEGDEVTYWPKVKGKIDSCYKGRYVIMPLEVLHPIVLRPHEVEKWEK